MVAVEQAEIVTSPELNPFLRDASYRVMDSTPRGDLSIEQIPSLLHTLTLLSNQAPVPQEQKAGVFLALVEKSSQLRARRDMGLSFPELGMQEENLLPHKQDLLNQTAEGYTLQIEEYLMYLHGLLFAFHKS